MTSIQRRATKYILNDLNSFYKSRLQQLNLLPLMYNFELQDLLFLIKSLKLPTENFNIYDYITFARGSTRSGLNQKLVHSRSQTAIQHHFYFNRIVRLYNSFPIIDLSLPTITIKRRITLQTTSTLRELVHFISYAHVIAAVRNQFLLILIICNLSLVTCK